MNLREPDSESVRDAHYDLDVFLSQEISDISTGHGDKIYHVFPIFIFDIFSPFSVTKSHLQWLKSHFPRVETGQSQFPISPRQDPLLAKTM